MKVYPEQHAALITLSLEEMNRFHYVTGDTEGFVNLPLSIENVAFSVFIREDKDYVKISLRSVGDFPCNQFASRYFNGGGHKMLRVENFMAHWSMLLPYLKKAWRNLILIKQKI